MLEACQGIVDDLIRRDIYDVSVVDLAGRLSGFKAVQELGNKAIIKVADEVEKLAEEKEAGENSAYSGRPPGSHPPAQTGAGSGYP